MGSKNASEHKFWGKNSALRAIYFISINKKNPVEGDDQGYEQWTRGKVFFSDFVAFSFHRTYQVSQKDACEWGD